MSTALSQNSTPISRKINIRKYPLLFVLPIFLLITCFLYGPSGDDDSHITYTAAQLFSETGHILNHNGERVEQGSSLLHVILLGAVSKITGLEPSILGHWFSLFFAMVTLIGMVKLCKQLGLDKPHHALLLASLSVSFSYWAIGGLETSLFAFTLVIFSLSVFSAIDQTKKCILIKDVWLWVCIALCILSRPEAVFLLLATAIGYAVLGFRQYREIIGFSLSLIVMISVVFIGVLVFRYFYFDALFPQPVYAKSSGLSAQKILFGLGYFLYSTQISLVLFSVMMIWRGMRIFIKGRPDNVKVIFVLSLCLSYLAFVVVSGGDWMTGGRFFSPIIPFLVILFLLFTSHLKRSMLLFISVALLMSLETLFFSIKLSSGLPWYQRENTQPSLKASAASDYSYAEMNNVVHRRDIPLIDALKQSVERSLQNTPEKVVNILSIQMGMPPYHLRKIFDGKVYFIDLRGLSTTHVTRCKAFDKIERRWTGVFISYKQYFDALAQCQLPKPDIVYDLLNRSKEDNEKRIEVLLKQGYEVVYQQAGDISVFNGLKMLNADAFVARMTNQPVIE